MTYHRDSFDDENAAKTNVFRNRHRGWFFRTLCDHLGMSSKAVKRQLKLKGLHIEARSGHTLTERDVETITGVVLARKAERLYGSSRRISE